MVARLVRDQEVVGSSPVTSTISSVHNRPKGLVWTLDYFCLKRDLNGWAVALFQKINIIKEQCDQTADGTAVCHTGIMPNKNKSEPC